MTSTATMLWLSLLVPAVGQAQPRLQNDLFAQPKLMTAQNKQPPLSPAIEVVDTQPPQLPRLTSVISAGDASIAVLDGVVLGLNQASGGYRLLQVGDRNALFMYDGRQVRVHLNGTVEPVSTVNLKKGKS